MGRHAYVDDRNYALVRTVITNSYEYLRICISKYFVANNLIWMPEIYQLVQFVHLVHCCLRVLPGCTYVLLLFDPHLNFRTSLEVKNTNIFLD